MSTEHDDLKEQQVPSNVKPEDLADEELGKISGGGEPAPLSRPPAE